MQRPRDFLLLCAALACAPSQEATRAAFEVALDAAQVTASTSDLGWRIDRTTARITVTDLQLPVHGEVRAANPLPRASRRGPALTRRDDPCIV